MQHTLSELPYAQNALELYISAETLELPYQKHHATYVATRRLSFQSTPSDAERCLALQVARAIRPHAAEWSFRCLRI